MRRAAAVVGCTLTLLFVLLLRRLEFDVEIPPSWFGRFHDTMSVTNNDDLVSQSAAQVDWSRFAYSQYATNIAYLCNSLMIFARLSELNCHAHRLMIYPQEWTVGDDTEQGRLLLLAREEYGVELQPVEIQRRNLGSDPTWADSYTKLLAVNQTQYDRVLNLDSDSVVLQCLDELFLLPSAPFAMPRSYWSWATKPELSDQLLLAEPNSAEMDRILNAVRQAEGGTFDMDIMNDLYLPSAMVLPHRDYDLLTGEFRKVNNNKDDDDPDDAHESYLGNRYESWNPREVLQQAKFLHFSDWPIPKPWLPITQSDLAERGPKCRVRDNDCSDRDIWYSIYGDFKRRRIDVCRVEDWGGAIENATLLPL